MKGGPCHEDCRRRSGTWWLLLLLAVFVHVGRAAVIDVYTDGVIDSEWMDWSFGYTEKNGAVAYKNGDDQVVQEYCIGLEQYGALSIASIVGSIPINGSEIDIKIRVNESSLVDVGDLVGNVQIMVEYAENSTEPVALRELLVSGPESEESDDRMQRLVDGKYVNVRIDVQELPGSEEMDSFNQVTLGACMRDTDEGCLPVSSICTSSFTISTQN